MNDIVEFGKFIEQIIVLVAGLLTHGGIAGLLCVMLVVMLVLAVIVYGQIQNARFRILKNATKIIIRTHGRENFALDLKVDQDIEKLSSVYPNKRDIVALCRGWAEYSETLVRPENPESDVVKNTVRPHYFLNSHELGFESKFWRQVPGLFVSVGLLLTFLGIISAIGGLTGTDGGNTDFSPEKMTAFLTAAKAKFLMSLTGLLCSIIFTLYYRRLYSKLEHLFHVLCDETEKRVLFQTPESIAIQQLAAIQDQSAQLKQFNNDLAAQLGHSLSVELPQAIANALSEKIDPVLNAIGNSSEDSVAGMVSSLGDTLHEKLNGSLNEIAETLNGVNTSLLQLTKELGSSGQNVASEVKVAIGDMSVAMETIRKQFETDATTISELRSSEREATQGALQDILSSIEKNTREGAEVLREASKEISTAAKDLTGSIADAGLAAERQASETVVRIGDKTEQALTTAGASVAHGIEKMSESILSQTSSFQDEIDTLLVEPIKNLENAMSSMTSNLNASSSAFDRHSDSVTQSTQANENAMEQMKISSDRLTGVSQPILHSIQNIQSINSDIKASLSDGVDALGNVKEAVEGSMSSLRSAVDRFAETVGHTDDIDRKLLSAFEAIKAGVEDSQDQLRNYSVDLEKQYQSGLASLQQAIDGLEDYTPPQSA